MLLSTVSVVLQVSCSVSACYSSQCESTRGTERRSDVYLASLTVKYFSFRCT